MRQKAITWVNVDPDLGHHMVSLGPQLKMKQNMLPVEEENRWQ